MDVRPSDLESLKLVKREVEGLTGLVVPDQYVRVSLHGGGTSGSSSKSEALETTKVTIESPPTMLRSLTRNRDSSRDGMRYAVECTGS